MTYQLVYASEPFGYDDAILNGILADSRRCNVRDGVTGALICRADLYLQLLEGDRDVVEATFDRIARDPRHRHAQRLAAGKVAARLFPGWAMLDDPARSWLWIADEVTNGALRIASPARLREIFARFAAEHA